MQEQDFGQDQYLLTQVAKFAKQWLFSLLFSCNVIGEFKKALKCDWLFLINRTAENQSY